MSNLENTKHDSSFGGVFEKIVAYTVPMRLKSMYSSFTTNMENSKEGHHTYTSFYPGGKYS
jgi:hypothetical protein